MQVYESMLEVTEGSAPMNGSKLKGLTQQVKQFAAQFAQSGQSLLGEIIPVGEMEQWVREEAGRHRERVYGPLRILLLFIEQVLSADHSCQDAVARGISQQVGFGQAPSSLNTGPYCKARQRLPLGWCSACCGPWRIG